MADGEGAEGVERAASRAVNIMDHPLLYAVAITFMVIALSAFFYWGFVKLGWSGPASLFR